jgi:hypothetical protein
VGVLGGLSSHSNQQMERDVMRISMSVEDLMVLGAALLALGVSIGIVIGVWTLSNRR